MPGSNIKLRQALPIRFQPEGTDMTGILYEVTLGKEDGASRTVRITAADDAAARTAADDFLLDGEIVVFVEEAEPGELTDDAAR